MGRPYRSDLNRVPATIDWALREDVSALSYTLLREFRGQNLVAIGSGGSLVAASFAALLHEAVNGRLARATTPLEAVTRPPPRNTAALLLSARGTNSDIRRVAEMLPSMGYDPVSAVTARKASPLARMLTKYGALTHEFDMPGGRDGFLATNSLIATLVLLYRAALSSDHSLGPNAQSLAEARPTVTGSEATLSKRTLVVLAHGWATPAAVDFESRFSEGALANVSVTDPRNFAHGRHHWLSLHADDTGIVSIETQDSSREAIRMLRYIPDSTNILRITSMENGPSATIELVRCVMEIVAGVAREKGIDPGQPFVADFGRRLFRSRTTPPVTTANGTSIARKQRALFLSPDSHTQELTEALRRFLIRLKQTSFTGLVLDYDGTICARDRRFEPLEPTICSELQRLLDAGIILGVASGRGKSVHAQLRAALHPTSWTNVSVGLYNGSQVMTLDKEIIDRPDELSLSLVTAHSRMCKLRAILGFDTEVRPYQISLRPQTGPGPEHLRRVVIEQLADIDGLSVLASSHAVDIVPLETSKVNVVKAVRSKRSGATLCIGDQGAGGGNDFDLLHCGLSLSVDRVSSRLETCWNIGQPGLAGPLLTLQYLRALQARGTDFHFDVSDHCLV